MFKTTCEICDDAERPTPTGVRVLPTVFRSVLAEQANPTYGAVCEECLKNRGGYRIIEARGLCVAVILD